ncbi:hypothetical protein DUNSADRAFT_9266 [Dunaliella salina]|uniref:C2 NT-type domain-containing protein n=1 Tax=Dunaliella salina TaxID=3046 RepID=A0ABQ7GHR4_DUNSA|nr:hypothetical protein DUNSADRAFT_9266 [Dunaliella salina]|eukprot:KAF5834147.1 hypothetical protein DUNSADRAFT_9266 [Dunaliella salina]
MLGLFGSSKRDKFNFAIELHHLAPFPELPSNRLLTLAWNRGKKRQGRLGGGYTRPFVSVPRGRGRLGHEIQMGYQTIELGATLEKLPRNGSALQEYKKKCLVVVLLETNAFTGDATPVGRVVMDLADFALINGQETRSFIVTCKKEIIQQVGHPQLLVTIRNLGTKGSRLSMSSSGGGRTSSGRLSSAVMDDTASDDATSVSSYGTEQSGVLWCGFVSEGKVWVWKRY